MTMTTHLPCAASEARGLAIERFHKLRRSMAALSRRWCCLAIAGAWALAAAGCTRRDVAACPAAPITSPPLQSPPSSSAPPSTPALPAREPEPVLRVGAKFQYSSAILKEERAYWVDLPESYEPGADTRYPVLYLLDADTLFGAASATVRFMSRLGTIPEMIIVGIPNTGHRTRDMTPTHSLKGPQGEETQRHAKSGGADAFLSSLQKELIPHIEATYKTMPYRVLAGHSLTGLFVLHAFIQDPASFHAVVAMDPSLWWDGHLLAKRAKTTISTAATLRNSIYIAAAHQPAETGKASNSPKAATEAFYQAVKASRSPHLRAKLHVFDEENHASVGLPGLYDGLFFTFAGYQAPASSIRDAAMLEAHYRQFSEKRGVTFEPPESAFAIVGWVLLFEQKKSAEAVALLEENAKRHPSSPSAHQYLGQAYARKGDKDAAVRSFERVLELKPDDKDATEALRNLRTK